MEVEWPTYLDEYEKLVIRMNTPRFVFSFYFLLIYLLIDVSVTSINVSLLSVSLHFFFQFVPHSVVLGLVLLLIMFGFVFFTSNSVILKCKCLFLSRFFFQFFEFLVHCNSVLGLFLIRDFEISNFQKFSYKNS